jgi:nucleoside-diphosphate-sugar epimerase
MLARPVKRLKLLNKTNLRYYENWKTFRLSKYILCPANCRNGLTLRKNGYLDKQLINQLTLARIHHSDKSNIDCMQTILGSGGAIGIDLAKELASYTKNIRLVSRNPKKVNDADEIYQADLVNPESVDKAVEGSEIVYVVVGFEYSTKVWQKTWPAFMGSVIESCKKHRSKLVFVDNIYMLDRSEISHMTESSPMNPSSHKGKVRKEVDEMIMQEFEGGKMDAIIARSADFYGPGISNSVLQEMVFKNLSSGKAAMWLVNADVKHSFTYTPDAARALAMLGNIPDAYNQVWNLPTHPDILTPRQITALFAKELNVAPKLRVMPKPMLSILSVFSPILKEMNELTYQLDREYFLDSSKFEKQFGFKPTTYQEGIKRIVEASKGS